VIAAPVRNTWTCTLSICESRRWFKTGRHLTYRQLCAGTVSDSSYMARLVSRRSQASVTHADGPPPRQRAKLGSHISVQGNLMTTFRPIIQASLVLLGLMFILPGCVVAPREGYWDRDQHRYYHEHAWHPCVDQDEHCR
jgi:hypothetical protein